MNYKIVIENKKGTYKSFESDDVSSKDYPLKGVTYPVDYGYIEGYKAEDGDELDVFVGTGDLDGYMKVWRYDVPIETKVMLDVTKDEWENIISEFSPVIKESGLFDNEAEREELLKTFIVV